ncbi:MAG: prepilin-type N-terminal cleavage/methylation domain-containing protein [Candidatus Omnitrophica bacterium]|nr:prepilin-type N-terminal cleavage/methylation domain-containing protein [Candidatus Omnitrophota bacterium]
MIRRSKALTFIELLIVIIIIGVLSAVAIPRFKSTLAHFEFNKFSKDIYFLSRYLQDASVNQGKIYYLGININNGELQAFTREQEEFRNIGGRFGAIYKAPQGVLVSMDPFEIKGINFYPDASTDQATIIFDNQNKDKISLIFKGASGGIQIK